MMEMLKSIVRILLVTAAVLIAIFAGFACSCLVASFVEIFPLLLGIFKESPLEFIKVFLMFGSILCLFVSVNWVLSNFHRVINWAFNKKRNSHE